MDLIWKGWREYKTEWHNLVKYFLGERRLNQKKTPGKIC